MERLRRLLPDEVYKRAIEEDSLILYSGDVNDFHFTMGVLRKVEPTEVYNLAAQSHVHRSFEQPILTARVDGLGVLNMLDVLRITCPRARFFQASSSELFGNTSCSPQSEDTSFYPRSPYAVAKLMAHWTVVNYRESYGIFACNGILYNHESPRRGEEYVTRKIVKSAVSIALGKSDCLYLGNLDAERDWGHAREYVECMWLMLQVDQPEDFVISTGKLHSVRELVKLAFHLLGVVVVFRGEGTEEVGLNAESGCVIVRVSSKFFRPLEGLRLVGDSSKATRILGWSASSDCFRTIIQEMVDSELHIHGYHIRGGELVKYAID